MRFNPFRRELISTRRGKGKKEKRGSKAFLVSLKRSDSYRIDLASILSRTPALWKQCHELEFSIRHQFNRFFSTYIPSLGSQQISGDFDTSVRSVDRYTIEIVLNIISNIIWRSFVLYFNNFMITIVICIIDRILFIKL